MVTVEQAQEGTMWVVILASALLAAARFAAYIDTVQSVDVGVQAALAWWSTYAIALGLIVVGLLGQRRAPSQTDTTTWGALLVGILVLVLMPGDPSGLAELGAGFRGPG